MSGRELVVPGTASQAPTRDRNHNGYLLRWDGFGVLFDPGEGTQRQMVRAGVASSAVDVVCVTHLHGDHCLGLPGVLARMTLDGRAGPVEILFPEPSELEMAILLHTVVGRRTWWCASRRRRRRDLDVVAFPGGQGQPAGALSPGPDGAGRRAPGRP